MNDQEQRFTKSFLESWKAALGEDPIRELKRLEHQCTPFERSTSSAWIGYLLAASEHLDRRANELSRLRDVVEEQDRRAGIPPAQLTESQRAMNRSMGISDSEWLKYNPGARPAPR